MRYWSQKFLAVTLVLTFGVALFGSSAFADSVPDENDAHTVQEQTIVDIFSDESWQSSNCVFVNETARTLPQAVILHFAGLSTFLSLGDIAYEDIVAESSNEDVAIFTLPGRILAVGAGTATITLNANGLSCIYSVTVESDLTDELRATIDGMGENAQNSTNISTRAYTNRGVMANKAKAMAAVQWTPTQNLTKWGGGSFPAGTTVVGIPYTQWAQCSDLDFKSKMNLSDFYSPVNIGGTVAPRYGNDCSGFVSYCWGIERLNTTGFMNAANSGRFTKINAWGDFFQGDAFVRTGSGAHIVMCHDIVRTGPGNIMAYEQTPPKVTYSYFTFSQILNAGYTRISAF